MTLKIKLLLIGLLLAALAASHWFAHSWGSSKGAGAEHAKCQAQNLDQLAAVISNTEQLVANANAASLSLSKTIADRITTDQKTTAEIRRALTTTAHLRVDCVLPDSVMQQISDARRRANHAAARGFNSAVPAATRAD